MRASPRPSANAGAPIERKFRWSEVPTKPELKGNYLLARTAALHRNAKPSDAVDPPRPSRLRSLLGPSYLGFARRSNACITSTLPFSPVRQKSMRSP